MRAAILAVVLVGAGGCAGPERFADADAGASFAGDASPPSVAGALQVEIESFEDEPSCTWRAPTGSRIAVKHCEPRNEAEQAAQAALQHQSQQDFDELRRRQLYYEQARQHALREAIIRRRGM